MSTINIKLPKSFLNTRSIAKKSELVLEKPTIFDTLKENHLVAAFDQPKGDEEPVYLLGFLKSATFTANGVKYDVAVISTNGDLFTATFDSIKYIPDFECPKVFFNNGTRQNIGHFIGLSETEGALVRVPPFGTYTTDRCALDSMCFCSDIPLGVSVKEDKTNAD